MQAIDVHRRIGNRYGEAGAQLVLAAIERDAGHLIRALDVSRLAVAIARDVGDQRVEADAVNTHASVHQLLGEHRRALAHFEDALDLAIGTDNLFPQTEALLGLAQANHDLAHHDQAVGQARMALAHARRAGYRLLEGVALTTLAGMHLSSGDLSSAAENGGQALTIHRATGYRLGAARAHLILGEAWARANATEAALTEWREAVDIFADVGAPETATVRILLASHNGHVVRSG
jgi:tetratricopeptide (TPR) repeat protein